MMTYYDRKRRRDRYKPRFVWAAWAFGIGLAFGLVVSAMI